MPHKCISPMQPQLGSIAHVHPRHYADFSQVRKHMVTADRKFKRNQTAKNVRRWECCTILPVSRVEHLLMYWPHSFLQPPGLKLHSLHSNRTPKSKLPWAEASSLCDRASEASSLSERAREGGARRREATTAMCCLASKTHMRCWQARPPSVKLTDLVPFQSS
jgi:hypothetical protein